MNYEVIVSCAVTGAGDIVGKSPLIPVTPEEVANAAIEAAKAGAAIAHIHVRDPETGKGSRDPELFKEAVDRIRSSDTDVVINLTSGMGGDWTPSDDEPAMPAEPAPPVGGEEHVLPTRKLYSTPVGDVVRGPLYEALGTNAADAAWCMGAGVAKHNGKGRTVLVVRGAGDAQELMRALGADDHGGLIVPFPGELRALLFKPVHGRVVVPDGFRLLALHTERTRPQQVIDLVKTGLNFPFRVSNIELQQKNTGDIPEFEVACAILQDTTHGEYNAMAANTKRATDMRAELSLIQKAIKSYGPRLEVYGDGYWGVDTVDIQGAG